MRLRVIFIILMLLLINRVSLASDLIADAVAENTEVYTGETFTFQIQVSGSEDPEEPDMSALSDFECAYMGGSQNSSSSITIINGQMTKNEKKGYVFSYRLTPRKTGTLVIPSITVRSGNDTAKTEPMVIVARKPVETEEFKLRLSLSKDTCYVGEPLILTVTWYIGKNVNDFNFNLPIVNDNRFDFADTDVNKQSGKKLYRIQLGSMEAIGEEGQGIIDGTRYATISFKKVLIPLEAGTIPIEQATVTCSALSGYSRRSNDPFSNFFDDDFFGSSRRAVYKTVVVPSNTLSLKVRELPVEGRPVNFSGHIGNYTIEANASPLEVNVGDPITLTITISGSEYLDHVKLPPLKGQADFENNFKIPDDMASAEIKGSRKIFTQTIRPLNSRIKEIPPVELPYFDTEKGEYNTAKSNPVPLQVHETKVVTLLDAEGTTASKITGSDIETWEKGIAFNYEDISVLEKQYLSPLSYFKNGLWPYLVLCPPFLFFILYTCITVSRKRNNDPLRALSRRAFAGLKKNLMEAERASSDRVCEIVLDSMRKYLGAKLRYPSGGAITFADVRQHLEYIGIEKAIIEDLKTIFESCEAGRYAGSFSFKDNASIINKSIDVGSRLEKRLK